MYSHTPYPHHPPLPPLPPLAQNPDHLPPTPDPRIARAEPREDPFHFQDNFEEQEFNLLSCFQGMCNLDSFPFREF